jgi:hypothetical protein
VALVVLAGSINHSRSAHLQLLQIVQIFLHGPSLAGTHCLISFCGVPPLCTAPAGVLWSSPSGQDCRLCGDNIASEARDLDEHPQAINGSLVRASSFSCCEYQCHCVCNLMLKIISVAILPCRSVTPETKR